MKVLSVRPPWAWLIFHGKDVENRDWKRDFAGPLLIHASKTVEKRDFEDYQRAFDGRMETFGPHHLGAIIGMVYVEKITMKVSSKWHNRGCWGWYLSRQVEFENPHFVRGALGLWQFEEWCNSEISEALKTMTSET